MVIANNYNKYSLSAYLLLVLLGNIDLCPPLSTEKAGLHAHTPTPYGARPSYIPTPYGYRCFKPGILVSWCSKLEHWLQRRFRSCSCIFHRPWGVYRVIGEFLWVSLKRRLNSFVLREGEARNTIPVD
ncbi:uncharacterized protein LAJ45_08749 [Morchella importuna]|uniref:uncharacterized protein n=1 Tax=Morchella importuna TaxID=1174673 RepID=UPI001E8EEF9D|nr:uncharacterized protein LAJ45_08749 [Morchella importuna]KAH8147271.1 hypothetical protein LAJ45_08749 [Morchella importuna]